ncbi:2-vinyl bacteriochlorophyllide hydratase [Polynucleobacter sp. es-GGE-1]|jgi:3-vinyl bacteriochlorophyllide hydratase|uniref:2-vinyl bacteriochlorophyllide hydratase n=1 Tax=unclassified Polynucleobacter TaxID=2640945 RepID=UPI00203ED73A|nr:MULTISPECIES: 2-vinyl bacteriochlorophyllide hydratase [unclassified Polynucleobacter]MBU3634962.1 2-vinyl bacteriochlorophyllide hydratase [Polynucleobacter sp. es-GGE-1]QWE05999.1 2-vinyl bacteriochlorophyllide hydratase [Polynucleobacter sp. JS-JIR-5-A7]
MEKTYKPLYTPEERVRRDETKWTLVQGILAPIQFVVFLVSLYLVLRFLFTGEGEHAANISVVVKTLTLYTIMITGCIWEKVVFNCYLFAPAFFWEDVFSMLVLLLHTLYLVALGTGYLDPIQLMLLALAAYATYVINAGQFIWKLRMARLDQEKKTRESMLGAQTIQLQAAQAASLSSAQTTLTGLSIAEAEELHRNLVQGTQFFGFMAVIAHLLAYIYSPWLK